MGWLLSGWVACKLHKYTEMLQDVGLKARYTKTCWNLVNHVTRKYRGSFNMHSSLTGRLRTTTIGAVSTCEWEIKIRNSSTGRFRECASFNIQDNSDYFLCGSFVQHEISSFKPVNWGNRHNPVKPEEGLQLTDLTIAYTSGRFRHRVPCTWKLPWLAIEWPWSALAEPFLTLLAQTGIEQWRI